MTFGVIVLVMFAGGLIAGLIGYSRVGGVGTFVGLFIFGALLPLIGIIVACLVKPKPTQLAGWYADPWTQAAWRWWDGYQWTWQTSGAWWNEDNTMEARDADPTWGHRG